MKWIYNNNLEAGFFKRIEAKGEAEHIAQFIVDNYMTSTECHLTTTAVEFYKDLDDPKPT